MKYAHQKQHKQKEEPRYKQGSIRIIVVDESEEHKSPYKTVWAAKRWWRGLKAS
jgi:4-hydroxyphenylpyruvate dioxygenase-like putative hemolysin